MKEYQASQYLYTELIPLKTSPNEIRDEFARRMNLAIECRFLSTERLFQIFSHKSFIHENPKFEVDNERLEFIGDAVLDLIIGEMIFKRYPEKSEGELSKLRSSLVNEKSLAMISEKLNIGAFVLLGKGELKLSGFEKTSILSDTFEALLGGIHIDHGYLKVFEFFSNLMVYLNEQHHIDFLDAESLENFDAKTKLQELTMKECKEVPRYEVEELKNDNETQFEVKMFLKTKLISSMTGVSKKKTMQALAQKVLEEKLIK